MSWWGTHARVTKAEARALLAPGACKLCVYWFRVFSLLPPPNSPGWSHRIETHKCYRCGCEQQQRVYFQIERADP